MKIVAREIACSSSDAVCTNSTLYTHPPAFCVMRWLGATRFWLSPETYRFWMRHSWAATDWLRVSLVDNAHPGVCSRGSVAPWGRGSCDNGGGDIWVNALVAPGGEWGEIT